MTSFRSADSTIATTQVDINISTSGANSIIAAPGAGKRIVLCDFTYMNTSATATTSLLQSGTTTFRRYKFAAASDSAIAGVDRTMERGREWRLGTNEAFVIDLSGANAHIGGCSYFVEEVS